MDSLQSVEIIGIPIICLDCVIEFTDVTDLDRAEKLPAFLLFKSN